MLSAFGIGGNATWPLALLKVFATPGVSHHGPGWQSRADGCLQAVVSWALGINSYFQKQS